MFYSQKISEFAQGVKYENLPQKVVFRAKELILDTLGVSFAGSVHPNSIKIIEGIKNISSSQGKIKAWAAQEEYFSSPYAVFANGACAHVLDFDDTHTASIVHASAILTPLTFALSQDFSLGGKKIIEAFVSGWEIASRVGMAAKGTFHERGFHTTSVAGGFGATIAASKLMGLSINEITNALGLCGSFSSGITEFLSNGSSSKIVHIGNAAHGGIISSSFAKANMSGPLSIFEGRDNIFKTHGIEDRCDKEILTKTLGEEWEILNVSIKPYPCCHFAHGFIDCAIKLREGGINPKDIKEIVCNVDEVPINFICDPLEDKFEPNSAYSAKFSLPYLFATALTQGDVTMQSFDNLKAKEVIEISKKLRYTKAAPNTTGFPKYFPGTVKVVLKNGQMVEKTVKINRGNPENPLSFDEVVQKFKNNAKDIISKQKSDEIIDKVSNLEKLSLVDFI